MNNDQLDAFSEKINRAFDNGKPIVLSWEEAQWLGEQLSQLTERPPLGEEVERYKKTLSDLKYRASLSLNGCLEGDAVELIESLARSLEEKEKELKQVHETNHQLQTSYYERAAEISRLEQELAQGAKDD